MSTNFLILHRYPDMLANEIAENIAIAENILIAENDLIMEKLPKINYQLKINIITQYSVNHILGSCIIDDIINFGWSKWEYNRPPDVVRVEDIIKYIEKGNSIDWMLYFIYSNENGLEIYDGLHRMTAISKYIKQFEKQQDTRCPLRDHIVIISIKINPTKGEIVDAFTFINQSVPVPELYFAKHIKKDIVENVVKKWQSKYRQHFKSTSRTHIPNINRDIFMDIVAKLYDHYDINEDKKKLEKLLNQINDYMLKNIDVLKNLKNSHVSEKILNKCKETGCYIFLIKHNLLFDYVLQNEIYI